MKEQIVETWRINNRVNLMLIEAISSEGLQCSLSSRGGGTPGGQFRHLHNLRLLKIQRYAGELWQSQTKIEKDESFNKAQLKKRLSESGEAFAQLIEKSVDEGGAIKGFKRGVVPMIGYLISHEAHHRGNILLTLKQCGRKLPKDVSYGIWAWNQI